MRGARSRVRQRTVMMQHPYSKQRSCDMLCNIKRLCCNEVYRFQSCKGTKDIVIAKVKPEAIQGAYTLAGLLHFVRNDGYKGIGNNLSSG
ncbi:hypothetical protein FACS189435_2910 [Bacteroidia bacterium]|nr:hypothetical protein FACS189435_2910 [Bacteroidia bacterium]